MAWNPLKQVSSFLDKNLWQPVGSLLGLTPAGDPNAKMPALTMPTIDAEAQRVARRRAMAQMVNASSGRASTILGQASDQLGGAGPGLVSDQAGAAVAYNPALDTEKIAREKAAADAAAAAEQQRRTAMSGMSVDSRGADAMRRNLASGVVVNYGSADNGRPSLRRTGPVGTIAASLRANG